jgi:SAM-dependent methyltransferase
VSRVREALEFRVRRLAGDLRDTADGVRGRRDPLRPPRRLLTGDYSDFERLGEEFLTLFTELGGLRPDHAVLDIGCGPGRMAVPLTRHLSPAGSYEGFDIVGEEVRWCQEHITPRFPGFRFQRADVRNSRYNPGGGVAAEDYRFPYPDASFGFAFATSVFTHMLAPEVERYLAELSRVLEPDGRALVTWFILDAESRAALPTDRFAFGTPAGPAFVNDPGSPEAAVAYPEEWVLSRCEANGLHVAGHHPGGWAGRSGTAGWQDVLVLSGGRRPA